MILLALKLIVWMAVQSPASVEGVVLETGTNAPIRDVTLQLSQTGNNDVRYAAISSQDGRFVFRAVLPGEYSLTASRAGYVRAQYGQRGPKGAASTLSLKAGNLLTNVSLTMMRGAAISGRVYDGNGNPAVNAQLHALKISYQTGWRLAVPVVSQMTNDRGEYRLFGLPPGLYYVSAQPESLSYIRSPSIESLPPVAPELWLPNSVRR
jgi:protocatechuate 3,4-dioxygenase beta subunit